MEIAIKSEADSRILVYPLIKALYNYGTIAVITSNRNMSRLIEGELEGGFKNIRILVSPEGDLLSVFESIEYNKSDYDFVILDNMGATEYDILLCIVTNRISSSYMDDLLFLCTDPKTHILKFGSAAPMPKGEKSKKKPTKGEKEESAEDDVPDDEFNKWKVEKTDEQILTETLASREAKWMKFPTMEAIEMVEGRHYMMVPGDDMIKEFYRLFGEKLNVDIRQFTKGARVKDESSSDISGTDVR